MTQRELAAVVTQRGQTIDHTAIARIEKGKRAARVSEALVIAEVLGTPLSELIPSADHDQRMVLDLAGRADRSLEEAAAALGNALQAIALMQSMVRLRPEALDRLARALGRQLPRDGVDGLIPWFARDVDPIEVRVHMGVDVERLRAVAQTLAEALRFEPMAHFRGVPDALDDATVIEVTNAMVAESKAASRAWKGEEAKRGVDPEA